MPSVFTGAADDVGPAVTVERFAADCLADRMHDVEVAIAATNEEETGLRQSVARTCVAVGVYDRAMLATFGKAATGRWGVGVPMNRALETVDGDRATVRPPGAVSVSLVRQDGRWKLSFAGVATFLKSRQVEPAMPTDEPMRRLIDMAEALRQVAGRIDRGEFNTAAAAADAASGAWVDAARGAQNQ